MRKSAVATLLVLSWLGTAGTAHSEQMLSFHYGVHRYGAEGTHSLLGLEGGYRFETPVSLALGLHYLSTDLGGTAMEFQQYRAGFGADYHLQFWCLLPFELSPGVGLTYGLRDALDTSHTIGGYVRGRLLVPIASGLAAGIKHRFDWNRLEQPGREVAAVIRVTF